MTTGFPVSHDAVSGTREPKPRDVHSDDLGETAADHKALNQSLMADWAGFLVRALRIAQRRVVRSPGFAVGVVLSFALGIGANAAIFVIINRLLLSPPSHVADAARVVRLLPDRRVAQTGMREVGDQLTYPDFVDFAGATSFTEVAAASRRKLTVGHGTDARQLDAALVTGSFFTLLGPRPALGRFFGVSDDRAGAFPVMVIGYGLWQRYFGGRSDVLTKTLDFGYGPYAIIGVAPRGFTGADLRPTDLWVPLQTAATQMQGTMWVHNRNLNWLRLVARIAPEVSLARAEAEASLLHRRGRTEQIAQGHYDSGARILGASLIAARGPKPSGESRVAMWLAGLSMLVLLIACANVANLLLARAVREERETGIRLALGSSRARLVGEPFVEILLLAAVGGSAALTLAVWTHGLLSAVVLPDVDWSSRVIDGRLAGFVLALTLLSVIIAGALPAIQAARHGTTPFMSGRSRGNSNAASHTRDGIIVLQAAMSVVLLVAAGLFVHSLQRLSAIDLGFDAAHIYFITLQCDRGTPPDRSAQFIRRATERLRALPEVERVTTDISVPFWSAKSVPLRARGLDSLPVLATGDPTLHTVDDQYFQTLRLKLVRGRAIERADDREGMPRVAVVNETMAKTIWPRSDAIGQCLLLSEPSVKAGNSLCTTVVGVVANTRRSALLEEATMQYYVPSAQRPVDETAEGMLVRVRSDGPNTIAVLRREITKLDPALRFVEVQPLSALTDPETRPWKLGAIAFGVFGVLALVVAGIGLYSVLAYNVAQRTLELGIRAALGAPRGGLVQLIARAALWRVATGLAIGVLITLAAAPRIEPLLYEVSPHDPLTFAIVATSLLLVATVASVVPARSATLADPAVVLRAE